MRANLPIANTSATSQPKGDWFARLAVATSRISGRPITFILAVAIVVVWAVTGPLFGFSDTWQLVINTGTTIVTFLMVFLIQATQNRDTLALPGEAGRTDRRNQECAKPHRRHRRGSGRNDRGGEGRRPAARWIAPIAGGSATTRHWGNLPPSRVRGSQVGDAPLE